MKTTVINIIAGSGCGKTTCALGLTYELKSDHYEAVFIDEWVKTWAYEGRKITQLDQPFVFAHQAEKERKVYNLVPYIVTDSPIILNPCYDEFYNGKPLMAEACMKFLEAARAHEVEHVYYLLKRNKAFNPTGRYETEELAHKFDAFLVKKLNDYGIQYKYLDCPDSDRVGLILKDLGIE